MDTHFSKFARTVALAGLLGCGPAEDDGAPEDAISSEAAPIGAAVKAAISACQSVTSTLAEHVAGGRAFQQLFLFWPAYYANGTGQELLGFDANQRVTLYPSRDGGFTSNAADCASTPASICGDGVIQPGEQCDGPSALGSGKCEDFGFLGGGTLSCTGTCQYELAACQYVCGNGIKEPREACDGSDFGGQTCATYGSGASFVSGSLRCTSSCFIDLGECRAPACGNGVAEASEQCDGADLRGKTCNDFVAPSPSLPPGTLQCTNACLYDTSACNARCGDGVIQSGEQCDGSAFNGERCQDFVYLNSWPFNVPVNYGSGELQCLNCQIGFGRCRPAPGCYYVPGRGGTRIQCL